MRERVRERESERGRERKSKTEIEKKLCVRESEYANP